MPATIVTILTAKLYFMQADVGKKALVNMHQICRVKPALEAAESTTG